MKTLAFWLAAGFCLLFSNAASSQNSCKERMDNATKLVEKGRFEEAKQMLAQAFSECCRPGEPEKLICAEILSSKGVMALMEGDAPLSLSFCLKADSIFRALNATDSTEYGAILSGVANAYLGSGDVERALTYTNAAIAFALRHQGPQSRQYAIRLSTRAGILTRTGQIVQALTDFETAFHLIDSLGKYSSDFITLSLNLATIYSLLGQFEQGLARITAGKTVADSILDAGHPTRENIDQVTGFLLAKAGRYYQAIPVLESGYRMAVARMGDNPNAELMRPCVNLATCYLSIGDLSKMEFYLNKALQLEAASPILNKYYYGSLRSNLAALYFTKGRYDLAMPLLQKALQHIETSLQGKYNPDYFNTLFNLASVYGENNQLELAETLLNQCKAILDSIYRRPVQDHIMYYEQLSSLQSRAFRDSAALLTAQKAFQIMELYPELAHSMYYPRILVSLGIIYGNLSQYDSALVYFEKAEKIYATYQPKPAEYSFLLAGMGDVFVWKKQPEKAARYMKECLRFTRDSLSDRSLRYAGPLSLYGFFLMKNGQPDTAQVYLRELLQVVAQNLDLNSAVLSEQGKVAFAENAVGYLNNPLSFALDYGRQYPEFVRSASDAVLNLRGYSLRSSREAYEAIRSSGDGALLEKYEQLRSAKQIINFQYQKVKGERTVSPAFLDSLSLAAELLEFQLLTASAAYRKERRKISGAMVREALPPGEAAVQFIRFGYASKGRLTDKVYYVAKLYGKIKGAGDELIFLCTETELRDRLNLGNIGNPQQRIARIYSPETELSMGDTVRTLYDLVWKKIEGRLGKARRVWLSPDGLLHRVAFGAIRKNSQTPAIGTLKELRYVANAGDLVERDSLFASETGTAALFGNIEYRTDGAQMRKHLPAETTVSQTQEDFKPVGIQLDKTLDPADTSIATQLRTTRDSLVPLLFAKQEVETAQTLLRRQGKAADTYQGYDALEERFKNFSNAASPHIVHLATHGDYLPNDPTMLNPLDKVALFMAGADSTWQFKRPVPGMEDQILRAGEVAVQNLSNTKLVVLSACKSGLGDVRTTEGVFGFQRAFRLAGADHLLISLWAVSDRHTAEFMEMFYRHWLSGAEIREAFGRAQAEMRTRYPHPYYWAAFVLY